MAPPAPKHGRRGDVSTLPSLALTRNAPYREAHDASERTRETRRPETWAACRAWFVDAWQASLPVRMHSNGVEADSALGSPRLAPAVAARTGHASDRGWGVTGWDRDGQPRGMTKDGFTRDAFLFYLERMLNSGGTERSGAQALVRWAYLGWDTEELAISLLHPRRTKEVSPSPIVIWETDALEALLERTIRQLWHDCQREPVRFAICRQCRRRECVCGERSEAQVNAEDAA